jgi:acyl-CoA thioester hydrolase
MTDFHETTVRVRYAETDQMGVVYHANHYVWFEIGRTEMLRSAGINYKEMETRDDCFIVVVESSCRYLRPARYDDVLRIRTRITDAKPRILRIGYELLKDSDGELLATGETVHVICDKLGRPKSLPPRYRRLFGITNLGPDPTMN